MMGDLLSAGGFKYRVSVGDKKEKEERQCGGNETLPRKLNTSKLFVPCIIKYSFGTLNLLIFFNDIPHIIYWLRIFLDKTIS